MQIDYNAKSKTYVAEVVTKVNLQYEIDASDEDHARDLLEDNVGLPCLTEFYSHHIRDPYVVTVLSVQEFSAVKDTELTD